MRDLVPWWSLETADLLRRLACDESGLTRAEAEALMRRFVPTRRPAVSRSATDGGGICMATSIV
jgi:hypothetical protein